MKPIYCINLCEFGAGLPLQGTTSLEAFISSFCTEAGFPECARLYVGSNFCANAFFALDDTFFDRVDAFCTYYEVPTTLTLPIVTEKNLDRLKRRIDELLKRPHTSIDEISVNDFGMLSYLAKRYDITLNLGRLFSRDIRDPRYPDRFPERYQPQILSELLERLLRSFPTVRGLEFDPAGLTVDLRRAPDDVSLGLHYPYCYISTGHICEYAAQGNNHAQGTSFAPERACTLQCLDGMTTYFLSAPQADHAKKAAEDAPEDAAAETSAASYTSPTTYAASTAHSSAGATDSAEAAEDAAKRAADNPNEGADDTLYLVKHGKTIFCSHSGACVEANRPYRLIYTPLHFAWTSASGSPSSTSPNPDITSSTIMNPGTTASNIVGLGYPPIPAFEYSRIQAFAHQPIAPIEEGLQ